MSAERRARTLASFEASLAARQAADAFHAYKVLYAWAKEASVPATARIVSGRVVGLSEHHEWQRRRWLLCAWCAQKIGWRNELRCALWEADIHRRLAQRARKEGR